MKRNSSNAMSQNQLVCQDCGNKDYFIEVMAEESHLVNGDRHYIRLVEGIVDHYACRECGASINTPELNER